MINKEAYSIAYLKGYYGYQNRGDELLLLGLLNRIFHRYSPLSIYIEAGDPLWLQERLVRHEELLPDMNMVPVARGSRLRERPDLYLYGGGEVVSDARPFPYNGRNYLLGQRRHIYGDDYLLLGGVGTEKKFGTKWLYRQLLSRAKQVVLRDEHSYQIAKNYTDQAELYHDFAENILNKISPDSASPSGRPYVVINVNRYKWDITVKEKISALVDRFPDRSYYFFPAAIGSDDALYGQVKELIPGISLYDRTSKTVPEIVAFIAQAEYSLAARLHILLILDHYQTPFAPIVYQEKITKLISSSR